MKYLVLLLILIGFMGTAFGQYLGDKLPPNTMMNDPETGKIVLPPSYVDFYYSDSNFEKYSVIANNYRYVIPYILPNGTISKISIDCNNSILELDVSTTVNQEWLTLALPRQLIDSKLGPQGDDTFMILVDSTEVKYSDITSEKLRIVIIPISNETSSIKIIGVNYPEHMGENTCDRKHNPPFTYLLSPLKQFKSGILYGDIQCKDGLGLIVKTTNHHFACVKPESISKLFERGWTSNVNLGGESSRHCYQAPETGVCKASMTKYYFDWDSYSCKSFTWGGCGGSVPFDTLQSCKSLCN